MELKVKVVGDAEEKSPQEQEQEVLDQHAAKEEAKVDEVKEEVKEEVAEEQPQELTEEDVLSHINKKYNKQINSVNDLFEEREKGEDLPEDVAAYLKYKKETGRGFEDYVKLNRNFTDMEDDSLLREYLVATEEGLDADDISDLMEDFKYDSEEDDEAQIRKTKLKKKKTIAKAKKYFSEQKEYYKEPLESSTASLSESDEKDLKAYRQYLQDAKTVTEEGKRRQDWFLKKTEDVFNSEFKGFEFALGDNKVTYSPGDVAELRKAQSTPQNFISKFIGEDGLLKDAKGYHRALAIAMNPDRFAKFFYDQGKSHATDDVMRKTKNINMSERKTPEVTTKGGMKIRAMSEPSQRGLRIKSIKRK